jgi:regulation of enolase protein 1 (concanavalin A-like superfamily)
MKNFLDETVFWINEPENYKITDSNVIIHTDPETDLWSETFYNNSETNAHMLLVKSSESYFSFSCEVTYEPTMEYDQSGLVIYQDVGNWAKCSAEYIDPEHQLLGSVITNLGYSDWSTQEIPGDTTKICYRLSRRESDFLFEASLDGKNYKQLRIFHMHEVQDEIQFGIYAASPWDVTFKSEFFNLEIGPCLWKPH